ncbi:MAG: hypothetical protein V3G42_08730 [Oscillospiraceae bacterium]
MKISEGIAQIIAKRNAKVPALQKKKQQLEEILALVQGINSVRDGVLANAEKFDLNAETKFLIYSVNTMDFENAMKQLIQFYENTIERFSRHEISIAVVGSARQGKSQLLQSISSLDNSVIPAFANNDCTGASSVIKNVIGSPLKAEISFRNEFEMASAVQAYLDNIFGEGAIQLVSFDAIKTLSLSELESRIPKGSAKMTKFEHLKKYVEHFDEWKDLVHQSAITVTDPAEIQKYVAQHNGEKENSPARKNYYYYLAVKEAVISCEFQNPETGSIVLRDTIGLGDTSLGISDKMLETIGLYSDAAVIVRRPETATGKLDDSDERLYDELNQAFAKRNMGKWLFWLINHTANTSPYGDNGDRCDAFKAKLDSYDWSIAESQIIDVANTEQVNHQFLPSVLKILIENIDAVDEGILSEIQGLSDKVYADFKMIQDIIKKILVQGAVNTTDTTDFLDKRWDELYDSGLMKLLKEYCDELKEKQYDESIDFKNKVVNLLKDSSELLPTEEDLLTQLQKGGRNRGIDVYTMRMDMLRTEFTREFIHIDEEVFDVQVREFKKRIVEIFASDAGGKLGKLLPVSDFETPEEWLHAFVAKYFVKVRYEQFKIAFNMLADFSLSVRGFLMHRIRDRIDLLNPNGYIEQSISKEEEAKKLRLTLNRKLKDVKEELLQRFQDELFREPNRVFYAIISEFYDRINFSYQFNMKDASITWEKFYQEHLAEIWSDEFRDDMKLNALYQDWSNLSQSLSKVTKRDFTDIIL